MSQRTEPSHIAMNKAMGANDADVGNVHIVERQPGRRADYDGGGQDDDTLLTSNQTRARVGNVSHMCLWRWQRDERVQFPQPIQINRRNYWRLGDLRRWQAKRLQMAAA